MSLIKRAYWPGVREGELLVHEVRPGERVKTAGALGPGLQRFLDTLQPHPKYTYVLVNAMGYSEYYGANANKDWYGHNPHLDFNGLLNTWEGIGKDPEADQMQGKNWPYGYPCFYGATVYAHHKNTDPQRLGFGDVIYAGINPVMKRVELVKRIFNEEAQKKGHTSILSRIRAGERVDVSMGCKVPFDLCSICTDWAQVQTAWKTFDPKKHRHPGVAILAYHKTVKPIQGLAVTRRDYCEHMRTMGGKIMGDGRKVFVYNDFPRFFDISFVWIGADRTARVMWHMADDKALPAVKGQVPASNFEKLLKRLLSGMPKTAAMEKEIPDGLAQAVHADAQQMPEMNSTAIRIVSTDPRKALTALAALGIVLTPGEFQRVALGEGSPLTDMLHKVSFDTDSTTVDDSYAVDPALFDTKVASKFASMMPSRSAFAPFMNARFLSPTKVASNTKKPVLKHGVMEKLAAQYAGYRLSVLEQSEALHKQAQDYLSTEIPEMALGADAFGQKANPRKYPGAGLLLGQGPMIHLLSAHLRQGRPAEQQIVTIPNHAFEDNNLFKIMTTIGAAIRSAILIDKAGGLVQAAKAVASFARKALT